MNREWMQIVERTPALQAVRDGVEPDKFVQQFIVGGGEWRERHERGAVEELDQGKP
jgi:hypothetical protein